MRTRPNRFAKLFYDTDWHSRLVSVLKEAKGASRSHEIQEAIVTLELLLSEFDECLHTVTAIQPIPTGIALDFALECVKECIDVNHAKLDLSADGGLALTITERGDREQVLGMARAILRCGLNRAKASIWASEIF